MNKPAQPTFSSDDERVALENYVLEALKKRRVTEKDLVGDLCLKAGWNWDTSRIFIASVKEKYRQELFIHQSRFFLIFYGLLAILGLIIFLATFDRGEEFSKINSCLEIELSAEFQQVLGSEKITQCYAIAASDLFSSLVRGGYESILVIIGGIGLIMFLLSAIGFAATFVRIRKAGKDQTQRIKYFS